MCIIFEDVHFEDHRNQWCPLKENPRSRWQNNSKPIPHFLSHLATSISKYQILSWMKPNLFVWKTQWNFRETFECSLTFLRWCVLFKRNFPHLEGDDRAKKMCLHWGKKREVPCKKGRNAFLFTLEHWSAAVVWGSHFQQARTLLVNNNLENWMGEGESMVALTCTKSQSSYPLEFLAGFIFLFWNAGFNSLSHLEKKFLETCINDIL